MLLFQPLFIDVCIYISSDRLLNLSRDNDRDEKSCPFAGLFLTRIVVMGVEVKL